MSALRQADRRAQLAAAALLVLAIGWAFRGVFTGEFLDFDDPENLLHETHWRALTLSNLGWMVSTAHMGHYQPLTWISYALDHALRGPDPGWMHVVNVGWHALAALAFLFVARRLLRELLPGTSERSLLGLALLAAGLFALHPLRCESVCWLTERRDVLSGALYLLALLAWCRFVQEGRARRDYVLCSVLLVLSLGAKAWGITFFGLLLVLDLLVFRRRVAVRILLLEKLPFLALALVAGALALWAQSNAAGALRSLAQHGLLERLEQAGYGALFYPARTLWPVDLRPIYSLPEPFDTGAPIFVLSLAAATLISLAAILGARRWPALAASWLAYLVLIAPVSGLAQAGPQLVAERYSYLACLPFALLAAAGFAPLARRWPRATLAAGAALCLVLVARTEAQARLWHDPLALWTHTLAVAPDEPHARIHLAQLREAEAQAAAATGDRTRAVALYEEALELLAGAGEHPSLPQIEINQGVLLEHFSELVPERRAELLAESLRHAERGLEQARVLGRFDPLWNHARAVTLFKLGRLEQALPDLRLAAGARPESAELRRSLALVLTRLGRFEEALPELRAAAELEPRDAGLRLRLARGLLALGRADEARDEYGRVLQLVEQGAALPAAELEEARAALGRR